MQRAVCWDCTGMTDIPIQYLLASYIRPAPVYKRQVHRQKV